MDVLPSEKKKLLSLCPIRCLSPTLCPFLSLSLPLCLAVSHPSLISPFGPPTAAAGKVLSLFPPHISPPSALSAPVLLITRVFPHHPSIRHHSWSSVLVLLLPSLAIVHHGTARSEKTRLNLNFRCSARSAQPDIFVPITGWLQKMSAKDRWKRDGANTRRKKNNAVEPRSCSHTHTHTYTYRIHQYTHVLTKSTHTHPPAVCHLVKQL